MEEENEEVLLYILLRRVIRRRRRAFRRHWVHPIGNYRLLKSQFYSLHSELQNDPEKFFMFYRMTERSFNELLNLIRDDITMKSTNMRLPITPEERLSITLRYLGSGCTFTDLHFYYRVGISTVSVIVKQVCHAIWKNLRDKCMALPSEDQWLQISDDFFKRSNFPNCLGCIDGKHIRITNPDHGGSLFMNYKNFFSIVLLAVCDSNYCFTYVDVGSYGKSSDSGIYKNSTFYNSLCESKLNIPGEKVVPNSNITLPHVFIGDEAFGLSKNLMRPYGGHQLTVNKRVFNYRLARARRYIECSFGILTNKWRIFHRPLNVSLDLAEDVVKAACILHNFVRVRDGYNFEDTLTIQGVIPMGPAITVSRTKSVTGIRDRFSEYFVSPQGELSWQYLKT